MTTVNEPFLISQLESRGRYTVHKAIVLLRQYGTRASIEPLKQCCLRPIRDFQITSIFTLQAIAGSGIADFAASLLKEKQFREKWAAMVVSCETCDASYRLQLEGRVKQAIRRKRACPEVGGLNGKTTEVLHYLRYLERTSQMLGRFGAELLKHESHLTEQEISAINSAF
jgi:hypothetical protein